MRELYAQEYSVEDKNLMVAGTVHYIVNDFSEICSVVKLHTLF